KSSRVSLKCPAMSSASSGEKLGVSLYHRWTGKVSLPWKVTALVLRFEKVGSVSKSLPCFTSIGSVAICFPLSGSNGGSPSQLRPGESLERMTAFLPQFGSTLKPSAARPHQVYRTSEKHRRSCSPYCSRFG